MAMELSWVIPWYRLLTPTSSTTSRWRLYLVLGGIYVLTYFTIRATYALRIKDRVRLAVLCFLLFSSVVFGFKLLVLGSEPLTLAVIRDRFLGPNLQEDAQVLALALAIGTSALAWRRGATHARQKLGPMGVMRSFRVGVLMFVLFSLLTARTGRSLPDVELFIFLFTGLIALGGGRFSFLGYVRGGMVTTFNKRRILGVAVVAGVLVGLVLMLGIFARGRLSDLLRQALLTLSDIFVRLLLLVMRPVLVLIGRILEWIIEQLAPLFAEDVTLDEGATALGAGWQDLLDDVEPSTWAGEWGEWLLRFLILVGVAIAIVVLFRGWRQRIRIAPLGQDEEREGILKPGDLTRLLLSLLRKRAQEAIRAFIALRHGERIRAAARIRRIYASLLALSADLGVSRPVSTTPIEFLHRLDRLFPSLTEELRGITNAYVRVRYGELPESLEQIEKIEADWHRVRTIGEQLRQGRKV